MCSTAAPWAKESQEKQTKEWVNPISYRDCGTAFIDARTLGISARSARYAGISASDLALFDAASIRGQFLGGIHDVGERFILDRDAECAALVASAALVGVGAVLAN